MTELKLNLLPDLEVIEKFILNNGMNENKASLKSTSNIYINFLNKII